MKNGTRALLTAALLSIPASAFAASSGPDWPELGSQIVNFIIYLAVIVGVARKPVQNFFQARREAVTTTIEASKQATAEANAKLAEAREKLDAFDAEREALLTEFREMGEAERRRIVAAAEAEAAKIVRDAEATAARETAQAKAALEAKLVDLALGKAAEDLAGKMTAVAQAQLIDNGIDALNRAAN